jgi:hypothetical protein
MDDFDVQTAGMKQQMVKVAVLYPPLAASSLGNSFGLLFAKGVWANKKAPACAGAWYINQEDGKNSPGKKVWPCGVYEQPMLLPQFRHL